MAAEGSINEHLYITIDTNIHRKIILQNLLNPIPAKDRIKPEINQVPFLSKSF